MCRSMASHHPHHLRIMPYDERIEDVAACNNDDDDGDDYWMVYSYVLNTYVVQVADDTLDDVMLHVENELWMMKMTMKMKKVKVDNKLLVDDVVFWEKEAYLVIHTTCSMLLHEP